MSRKQIRAAIESGVPFTIFMADGKQYEVPHPDYISMSPKGSFVTVYNDDDGFYVLPFLTMTGISSENVKEKQGA